MKTTAEKKTYSFSYSMSQEDSKKALKDSIISALKELGLNPKKGEYGNEIAIDGINVNLTPTGGGRNYYASLKISNPEGRWWYKGMSDGKDKASDHRFYIRFRKEVTGRWLKSNIKKIVENYKKKKEREESRILEEESAKKTAQAIREALKKNGINDFDVEVSGYGTISINSREYYINVSLNNENNKVHSFEVGKRTFYDKDEFRVYVTRLIRLQDFINKLNKILKTL